MNIIKMYRSRKYLLRILLSITLLVAVYLIISSALQYYNFRGMVIDNQRETNAKVLNQVNYNINYMSELVKTLTMSIYFDSDTITLMNSPSPDVYNLYSKIDRMSKVANSTTFIHSIMIYNQHNGCYYSTIYTASCEDDGMNLEIDRYLSSHDKLIKLKFIPFFFQHPSEQARQVDLFSVFMYDSFENDYHKESALIVNVKPEWLFDNVDNINRLSDQADSSIVIMDSNGAIFNPDKSRMADEKSLSDKILTHLAASNKTIDNFIEGTGKNKKYITYMYSETNNWTIVSVQSYQSVFGKVDKMRTNSILIIVVFLALSAIVSVIVSYKLYQPIEKILQQIKRSSLDKMGRFPEDNDELSFISSEYQMAVDNVTLLQRNQDAKINIMKTYHLRRLVNDSSDSFQEIRDDLEQSDLKVNLYEAMVLCVLKYDNFVSYSAHTNDFEKKLHRFAIANIAGEIIAKSFRHEIVDMRSDHFIILVNLDRATGDVQSVLVPLLKDIQLNIMQYYRISLTAALSEPIASYREITISYGQAMEYAQYRQIYGKMSIITASMVKDNVENSEFRYSEEIERKLVDAIKSNDLKQEEELLNNMLLGISKLNYNNIAHSILNLTALVNNVMKEINRMSIRQTSVDMEHFYRKIMEQETLEETRLLFLDLFREISESRSNIVEDSKNDIVIDTIKEIIEENYSDANLNLQGISSMLKMSTAHISKIFKNKTGFSVAEYITEIRLAQSLRILENNHHNYSVSEIAEKIGFANQSYYFKLFKKKYGTTPKEYQFKKIVK